MESDDVVEGREIELTRRRLGDEEMGQSPSHHDTSPLDAIDRAESSGSLGSSRVAESILQATGGVRGMPRNAITESGYISFSTLRGNTADRVERTFYGPERRSPRPERTMVEAGKSLSIS
ncbi:hypothetical protein RBB50_005332 [Rhinocladiella similis]